MEAISSVTSGGNPAVEQAAAPEQPSMEQQTKDVLAQLEKVGKELKELSGEERDSLMKATTQHLNAIMDQFDNSIRFRVHSESGNTYAQVVNRQTNEVVKTVPSEEYLAMVSRFHDLIGLIFDEKS